MCFIDGFNLYHAIDDLRPRANYLKWVDLRGLASAFIKPSTEELADVFYFSAYATWIPDAYARHRAYVKAVLATGVTPVLGQFKNKDRQCLGCKRTWTAHEEKESDVNLAIHLVQHAHLNNFDKALVMTADSDLCPAIRMVLSQFPEKEVQILVPPNRYDISRELRGLATAVKIRQKHLKRNLLPATVHGNNRKISIQRPKKYQPPA